MLGSLRAAGAVRRGGGHGGGQRQQWEGEKRGGEGHREGAGRKGRNAVKQQAGGGIRLAEEDGNEGGRRQSVVER